MKDNELLMWHWELPQEIEEYFLRAEAYADSWVRGREGEPGMQYNYDIRALCMKDIQNQREQLCRK